MDVVVDFFHVDSLDGLHLKNGVFFVLFDDLEQKGVNSELGPLGHIGSNPAGGEKNQLHQISGEELAALFLLELEGLVNQLLDSDVDFIQVELLDLRVTRKRLYLIEVVEEIMEAQRNEDRIHVRSNPGLDRDTALVVVHVPSVKEEGSVPIRPQVEGLNLELVLLQKLLIFISEDVLDDRFNLAEIFGLSEGLVSTHH